MKNILQERFVFLGYRVLRALKMPSEVQIMLGKLQLKV